MYLSGKELLNVCKKENISICEATLRSEEKENYTPRDEIFDEFKKMYKVMLESTEKGLHEPIMTMSGLTGGNAKRLSDYMSSKTRLNDDLNLEAMARAISVLEVNGAMGKIVATPTAGAAGILPAALISVQNKYDFSEEEIIKAMVTAGGIGGIIAMRSSISGAEGGCQAETGSAAAMAAGALVELLGGDPECSLHAASFALIHIMGLVCDPVGGLVEFPCFLRNAIGVTNAFISTDMAMAGIKSIVPFDEVVDAQFEVGNALPASLRETALGGLAQTKTGCSLCHEGICR